MKSFAFRILGGSMSFALAELARGEIPQKGDAKCDYWPNETISLTSPTPNFYGEFDGRREFAFGDRDHGFATYDLALEMGIGVVFAGPIVTVAEVGACGASFSSQIS